MKAILTILIVVALSGCVSYPYTMIDDGQGVYYQDPVDVYGVSEYQMISNVRYYPYWSMDYFYLGAGYYDPWYGAYYSPWFYPYYFAVWYPPLYRPWGYGYGHGRYSAWHDPFWYDRYHHYQQVAYPTQRPRDLGAAARGRSISGSGMTTAEPGELRQDAVRRTSFGSPGITASSNMTVVSPTDGKPKRATVGPTRSTGISARVTPSSDGAVSGSSRGPVIATGSQAGPRISTSRQTNTQRPSTRGSRSSSRSSSVERRRSSAGQGTTDRD